MRKLLFIFSLLVMSVCTATHAQTKNGFLGNNAPTYYFKLDTVVNTATDSQSFGLNSWRNGVTFQTDVYKISGTPTGSYVQIWEKASATVPAPATPAYTLLYTDTVHSATQTTFQHVITGNPYNFYMVTYTGVGTAQVSWQTQVTIR